MMTHSESCYDEDEIREPGYYNYLDNRLEDVEKKMKFNILDGSDENVLGSSVPLGHCYISQYAAVQSGEKMPKDLEVGESTRAEFRVSMTKPTIYKIVRVD